MKTLLSLIAASFLCAPAFAGVTVDTDCAKTYGPEANNLGVSTDYEFVDIGYFTDGIFFSMGVTGCKKMEIKGKELLCDGARIGQMGEMESTSDNGGEPRASLTLDPQVQASITGSCGKKKIPLRINIAK